MSQPRENSAALHGMPVTLSPYAPRDKVLVIHGREVVIFGRSSTTTKWRRKHGRPRSHRRVARTTSRTYSPLWTRLREGTVSV